MSIKTSFVRVCDICGDKPKALLARVSVADDQPFKFEWVTDTDPTPLTDERQHICEPCILKVRDALAMLPF